MEAVERMKPIADKTLFYGDNLIILREHIPTESVDLIYLDPPFNSNQESYHRKIHPLVVLRVRNRIWYQIRKPLKSAIS
jgi:16S rRNA G966 N2-methylase RsmD